MYPPKKRFQQQQRGRRKRKGAGEPEERAPTPPSSRRHVHCCHSHRPSAPPPDPIHDSREPPHLPSEHAPTPRSFTSACEVDRSASELTPMLTVWEAGVLQDYLTVLQLPLPEREVIHRIEKRRTARGACAPVRSDHRTAPYTPETYTPSHTPRSGATTPPSATTPPNHGDDSRPNLNDGPPSARSTGGGWSLNASGEVLDSGRHRPSCSHHGPPSPPQSSGPAIPRLDLSELLADQVNTPRSSARSCGYTTATDTSTQLDTDTLQSTTPRSTSRYLRVLWSSPGLLRSPSLTTKPPSCPRGIPFGHPPPLPQSPTKADERGNNGEGIGAAEWGGEGPSPSHKMDFWEGSESSQNGDPGGEVGLGEGGDPGPGPDQQKEADSGATPEKGGEGEASGSICLSPIPAQGSAAGDGTPRGGPSPAPSPSPSPTPSSPASRLDMLYKRNGMTPRQGIGRGKRKLGTSAQERRLMEMRI